MKPTTVTTDRSPEAELKPLTVVVIDDDPVYQKVLAAFLSRLPNHRVEVRKAFDYEAGVRLAMEPDVDCVLLDYRLGGESGLGVLESIRRGGNDVPVLVMSGAGNERVAVEALQLGAQDYFVKGKEQSFLLSRQVFGAIEKVQMERKLSRHKRDLQRANDALKRITFIAAHDLRDPARSISRLSRLIQERYHDQLDSRGRSLVEQLVSWAARSERMLGELLEYGRNQSRGRTLRLVDCNEAVRSALINLEAAIAESEATITASPLPEIVADPAEFKHLFQFLLANAIKFRRRGVPPAIEVGAERMGNAWVFSVKDNGKGIAPDALESIFDLFGRSSGDETDEVRGIGLTACRLIVERLQGRIWAESELGKGSVFRFLIPDRKPAPPATPA